MPQQSNDGLGGFAFYGTMELSVPGSLGGGSYQLNSLAVSEFNLTLPTPFRIGFTILCDNESSTVERFANHFADLSGHPRLLIEEARGRTWDPRVTQIEC